MTIWAFNRVDDDAARNLIYESVKKGKSRFGWSSEDNSNLLLKDNWSEWHSKQLFLLQIQPEDWIVHISTPSPGKCIAAKVKSSYNFDGGLECSWGNGKDFRHNFDLYTETVIEFKRRDPNILPTVNLNPRQRYHRIYAQEDFLESVENLKKNVVNLKDSETPEEYHLKDKTEPLLKEIVSFVQEMNKSKKLERFLAKVFRKVPGVVHVNENGFGWGSDFGADLILTVSSSVANVQIENRIIIQVKSFTREHFDLSAVEQVKLGIEKYDGTAGIIITTAQKTGQLEQAVKLLSDEIGKPIDLLAYTDLAKFIIRYAPELLFRFEGDY